MNFGDIEVACAIILLNWQGGSQELLYAPSIDRKIVCSVAWTVWLMNGRCQESQKGFRASVFVGFQRRIKGASKARQVLRMGNAGV